MPYNLNGIGFIFILACAVSDNQLNALQDTNEIIDESRNDEVTFRTPESDKLVEDRLTTPAITTTTLAPFNITGWNLGAFAANFINDPYPRKKKCVKYVDAFLNKVRTSQRFALDYWREMPVKNEIKWSSLESLYDAELISVKLMYKYTSKDENKYFIGFANLTNTECKIVSLGISFDYSAETHISNQYPYCNLTAVDPMADVNQEIVQRVIGSRYFKGIVGGEDGNFTIRRLVNDQYRTINVTHIGIEHFFNRVELTNIIDLLIIDTDGAEFGILRALIEKKERLPMICQINFELHFPTEKYGSTLAEALESIDTFLTDGTYSIFNIDVSRHFLRIFVVNTINSFCIQKFFC